MQRVNEVKDQSLPSSYQKNSTAKPATAMKTDKAVTRILIVDDDEDDFFITSEYIKNIAGREFIIDWTYNYKEALDSICTKNYDLYFVDYRLGAKTGLDLIRDAQQTACEEPIILLTGKGNQEIDIQAMEAGAVDYLIKPELSTEKLERSIRYSLERTESLKALKTNERKFRSIFERSKDAVFLADNDLFFKDINYATTELLGYEKENLLSISLFKLLTNKAHQEKIMTDLFDTGDVDDMEVELLNATGDKKYCILSLSKEADIHGDLYIQGIIHDITNFKKVEKANLQLEKLAIAGRLVRTLAHEVRNPLNNISLAVQQISPENLTEQSRVYLDIVERNTKRIGDLIAELLNFSRPAEIVKVKIALQQVLDESIAAALDRITLKHIQLEVKYPDEPAWIFADAKKLHIAFLNIIINAIEAMEENKGLLHIELVKTNNEYNVLVSDNGIGISEENLPRLFEPYFTSKRNGLGLGLATTLIILQQHKASVDVNSKLENGTVFNVKFSAAG